MSDQPVEPGPVEGPHVPAAEQGADEVTPAPEGEHPVPVLDEEVAPPTEEWWQDDTDDES